jgi:hypothetical protein
VRNRAPTLGCLVAAIAAVLTVGRPAGAQSLSRASIDSVAMVDLFAGDGTSGRPDSSLDISSVVRLGAGWHVHVRPWFFRSSTMDAWNKEIYQAAVRYERPGPVALRVEGGYIASPIGLGMLDMRADINPTIQSHLSYFVPLLPFDRSAPSVRPIAASYPLGALATLSTRWWDARAAIVNSAPTRRYALNARNGNPRATPVFIAGGGITPRTGLRLGASMASGQYATAEELRDPVAGSRDLLMWTLEGEYAFGYTKLAAEVTRERFSLANGQAHASTWFVQATQTLSPRWFLAGRHEAIHAPVQYFAVPGTPRPSFRTSEATAGYRLTRELILRTSLTATRGYTAATTDFRVGAQLVWSRRWW